MFFSLNKKIYAGYFDNTIIILDAKRDKYFSITDSAALAFKAAITTQWDDNFFESTVSSDATPEAANALQDSNSAAIDLANASQNDNSDATIDTALLKQYITHFLEQGFIEKTDVKTAANNRLIPSLKSGGLRDYQWDYKSSLASFAKTSKRAMFRAWCRLMYVHYLLKRKGINGILNAIEKTIAKKSVDSLVIPTQDELKSLSDSVDLACAFYSKKVFCLGWASTFVLLALEKGWKVNLAIGVQNTPFYAHAWAECNGKVINDEQQIQEYLSVLLKEPYYEQV